MFNVSGMTLVGLLDEVSDAVEKILTEDMTHLTDVCPLGLDNRCNYSGIWINGDYIVVKKSEKRVMEYYGGFEYVDRDYVTEIGDYVIYSREDGRVDDHIFRWEIMDLSEEERDAKLEARQEREDRERQYR
jgi:hypothetical protein